MSVCTNSWRTPAMTDGSGQSKLAHLAETYEPQQELPST